MRRRFRSNLVYPMYTSHQESALIIELSNMERDENRPEIWLPLKTSIAISIASRDFIFVYWWIFVDITLLQARDHCIIINCYFFFTSHFTMLWIDCNQKKIVFFFFFDNNHISPGANNKASQTQCRETKISRSLFLSGNLLPKTIRLNVTTV